MGGGARGRAERVRGGFEQERVWRVRGRGGEPRVGEPDPGDARRGGRGAEIMSSLSLVSGFSLYYYHCLCQR